MTPHEFIAKWQAANLSERSACQQHFLDLCDMLGQPKPAAADPEGAWYTFERGVRKQEGGNGWADVWKKDCFGWEYKGKHKNLDDAYRQLLRYREDLNNPPLLVVCDLDRFEIHTNFTGTAKVKYEFDLEGLNDQKHLDTLRKLFTEPEALKPGVTPEGVTKEVAERFGQLADRLRVRGIAAQDAAHFLMKLMFCMFAEDIKLLPEDIFTRLLKGAKKEPPRLATRLKGLFTAMADGSDFGPESILYFNGGLFADADVIELNADEIQILIDANVPDWSNVEPSIFGTLFERTLDPAKRSQIGAHYTSREDIETLLEPVVMTPLRREWQTVREKCDALWSEVKGKTAPGGKRGGKDSKTRREHDRILQDFIERLAHVTILDPACGSGNFLYVAIHLLLNLEKEVLSYAAIHGTTLLPQVRPTQLSGIEINPYAQQLAQVVIWIGYLQWKYHNAFPPPRDPVLEPIESIQHRDAILDLSDPENPKEPKWPKAEFIVGNPPFLGGQKLRSSLGDKDVEALFRVWGGRVPNGADLCCYWFEKARAQIEKKRAMRAGLLATQGIRGGSNRQALERICDTGNIFFAVSDRDWILDGANVHISIVGFDDGSEKDVRLDERRVPEINPDLTFSTNVSSAAVISGNRGIAFQGPVRVGAFDMSDAEARYMLTVPNPHGTPNSDVLRPTLNGTDIVKRSRTRWTVDFVDRSIDEACQYERPFAFVEQHVRPGRERNPDASRRNRWWLHGRTGDDLRSALGKCSKYVAMAQTAKYFLWRWYSSEHSPEQTVIAFALTDDMDFGIVHSRVHVVWALRLGTRLETRPRYTPTTCLETFPFPDPTPAQREAIAVAARDLDRLRTAWLNPPEWTREEVLEFPGSVDGPWARYVYDADAKGIGTVRYPRLAARDEECAAQLAKRTLTNLYNQRPTWLALAHEKLDAAVAEAYGWPADLSEEEILARLLALNLERSGT
jgi:hypothetical protein